MTSAYYNNQEDSIIHGYDFTLEKIKRILEADELWIKQLIYEEAMQPITLKFKKEELV